MHSSSPSFTYCPPWPTLASTRNTVPSQGATTSRALKRSIRLSISWISRSIENRFCSLLRRLERATAIAERPAASACRRSASWVSRAAWARWISAAAFSVSVKARSARIRASSRLSLLSRPPNVGFVNRSSNISKRLFSNVCANSALAPTCLATSIDLRAASRFASAAFTAASRADSWAFAAASCSITSSFAAAKRPARNSRWASNLAASSGSLSSISTTGSFIFTRLPSTTCHLRTCPETRAVSTCMRSTGEYATTCPRPCTVCCQGTKARRNGVARKSRTTTRPIPRTIRGVAERARTSSNPWLCVCVRASLMTTPPSCRSGCGARRGPSPPRASKGPGGRRAPR